MDNKDERIETEESISPEEAAYDEKLLEQYEKWSARRAEIIAEKKEGKYKIFHKMLLAGELRINDPFSVDILCRKNTKDHEEEINACQEKCLLSGDCPKLAQIDKRPKTLTPSIIKQLKKRADILRTSKTHRDKGKTYEDAKKETIKELKLSGRTFDKFYKTRNMDLLAILKEFQKK